jgi:hypothetical protein
MVVMVRVALKGGISGIEGMKLALSPDGAFTESET